MTIPVRFNNSNNEYQYLSFSNLDLYNSIGGKYKDYEYRVVISQVDKVKFQNAQLQSKKETETATEEAHLDASNQSYLSGTGKDGTEGNGDSYNLQAYMANYYKEMEKQGLQKNESVDSITKLQKQKISYTNFANEIYEWKLDFSTYLVVKDFASWADNNMNADGTSTSMYYSILDSKLEGMRPTKFSYENSYIDPTSLASYNDAILLKSTSYYLKDPYVWLAYMGSYALFNGREISSKSGYWDEKFESPAALKIVFPEKSGWYRGRKNGSNILEHTIGYSNRGQYVDGVNFSARGINIEYADYDEASNFIKDVAVGYRMPTYNDCLYKNISNGYSYHSIYTSINAIKDMLDAMHYLENDFRKYYYKIWGESKSTIKSTFSQWNSSGTRLGGDIISCPAIQVGFVYQAEWMVDKGSGDWKGYFPGYPDRYCYYVDQVALSINNYSNVKANINKENLRFQYDWYCNNLKSVTHEYYRCNAYNLKTGEYTVRANTSEYTLKKDWSYPLKNYTSGYTWYLGDNFPIEWK